MSVLYSDDDGFFISHQMFISKLYDTILNKTENTVPLYEHFFHINNPFVRDNQQIETSTENNLKRKRKRPKYEVVNNSFNASKINESTISLVKIF